MRSASLNTAFGYRDFSQRSRKTEWLDQEGIDPEELGRVLHDLARFNAAMLGHTPVLRWLKEVVAYRAEGGPLRLVDAGCGYGDLLRKIRRVAARRGLTIALQGVDVNRESIHIARSVTDPGYEIAFEAADIFEWISAEPVDLIVSSLFAHHLSDERIIDFIAWMEKTATRGWLICDLQRHPLPYYVIGLAGKVTPLHPGVFHDGQISVRRALTHAEWQERLYAAEIPLDEVTISSFWCRYAIGRLR